MQIYVKKILKGSSGESCKQLLCGIKVKTGKVFEKANSPITIPEILISSSPHTHNQSLTQLNPDPVQGILKMSRKKDNPDPYFHTQ